MLKITAIGNVTNDVELRTNEVTGKPYAILRIASDRRYRTRDGRKLTDFISIKVRDALAERCAAYLQLNTGVKHIFGLLAVDAIDSDRNRG